MIEADYSRPAFTLVQEQEVGSAGISTSNLPPLRVPVSVA